MWCSASRFGLQTGPVAFRRRRRECAASRRCGCRWSVCGIGDDGSEQSCGVVGSGCTPEGGGNGEGFQTCGIEGDAEASGQVFPSSVVRWASDKMFGRPRAATVGKRFGLGLEQPCEGVHTVRRGSSGIPLAVQRWAARGRRPVGHSRVFEGWVSPWAIGGGGLPRQASDAPIDGGFEWVQG
jgi:hypothetical protein